jgi:putative N6-adenine-specific DNA methylase
LHRKFAFESFKEFDKDQFEDMIDKAEAKIFKGDYKIVGYDIDANMINIAKANAIDAGVDDIVSFEKKELSETKEWDGYIITNPPYGKRM